MDQIHSSLNDIKEVTISFGHYKGKTIEEVLKFEDGIEFLEWYRKKLRREIKNPKANRFKAYNERSLKEINDILDSLIKNDSDKPNNESHIDYSNYTFKELNNMLIERILQRMDKKIQLKKYIDSNYLDYLCLRYSNLTYMEVLQSMEENNLINILINFPSME